MRRKFGIWWCCENTGAPYLKDEEMLDLDEIRAEFARHLMENTAQRWRLDASVAHVVRLAYEKGMADAMSNPASVLSGSLTNPR